MTAQSVDLRYRGKGPDRKAEPFGIPDLGLPRFEKAGDVRTLTPDLAALKNSTPAALAQEAVERWQTNGWPWLEIVEAAAPPTTKSASTDAGKDDKP